MSIHCMFSFCNLFEDLPECDRKWRMDIFFYAASLKSEIDCALCMPKTEAERGTRLPK